MSRSITLKFFILQNQLLVALKPCGWKISSSCNYPEEAACSIHQSEYDFFSLSSRIYTQLWIQYSSIARPLLITTPPSCITTPFVLWLAERSKALPVVYIPRSALMPLCTLWPWYVIVIAQGQGFMAVNRPKSSQYSRKFEAIQLAMVPWLKLPQHPSSIVSLLICTAFCSELLLLCM